MWKAFLILLALINTTAAPRVVQNSSQELAGRLFIEPGWLISLPAEPGSPMLRAAEDLRGFLKRQHSIDVGTGSGIPPKGILLRVNNLFKDDGFRITAESSSNKVTVEGSCARSVYQGVLLLEDLLAEQPALPAHFEKKVSFPFRDRYLLWDSLLTGQNKGAIGFDLERHVREAVRLGYTGMECNRFIGMNLIQQGDPHDPYPWYTYWGPSMDQFVSTPLFEGVFPKEYLAQNLADLKQVAHLVESFGLKPIFMGYEPRYVPEEFFQRNPNLRGPRVDHPLRSMTRRYSLCIDQPEVLEHYRVLSRNLAKAVPAIREMHIIPQDSGAGMCWGNGLYAGRNGPDHCRTIPAGTRMQRFFNAIRTGLRDGGLDIPIVVQPHKMSRPEVDQFFSTVPKDIEFTAGNWTSWSLTFRDPLEIDRHIFSRQGETGRRRLFFQQHFFGFDGAPTSEFPVPYLLADRLIRAKEYSLDALNTLGGMVSPPVKGRSAMQEIYRCFLLEPELSTDELVSRAAADLGGAEAASVLLTAWKDIDDAIQKNGRQVGFAMGTEYASRRTLVRPLVPEASALSSGETDWWLNYTFGGHLRFGQAHLFRAEGGLPGQDWYKTNYQRSVRAKQAFLRGSALLQKYIGERPEASGRYPYLVSHERQLRFLGCVYSTGANLYEGQRILDKYSAKGIEAGLIREMDADLVRFKNVVEDEIRNTQGLLSLVEAGGDFGMVLLPEETTWAYGRNLPELLRRKIDIMKRHLPEAPEVLKRWFDSEY
jgi:hypothetical protein